MDEYSELAIVATLWFGLVKFNGMAEAIWYYLTRKVYHDNPNGTPFWMPAKAAAEPHYDPTYHLTAEEQRLADEHQREFDRKQQEKANERYGGWRD